MRTPEQLRAILAAAILLLPGGAPAAAQGIGIVEEGESGLLLEAVPGPLELKPAPGQPGRVIPAIAGAANLDEEGMPRLPFLKAFVAIPRGFRAELEILDSPSSRLREAVPAVTARPYFGVTEEEGWAPPQDAPLPAGPYPRRPAEIAWSGWLRDMQVAEVRAYPVRSAGGSQGLLAHSRIRMRVRFVPMEGEPAVAPSRGPVFRDAASERSFRNLQRRVVLNGERALRDLESPGFQASAPPGELLASGSEASPYIESGSTEPLKITVDHDGLYAIGPADLSAAGIDPLTVDPRDFRLESMGAAIPVEVLGESDGVFDPNDRLVFHGRGMTGRFTRRNVYWLHLDGSPSRAGTLDGTFGAAAPTPASFQTTVRAEQNLIYTLNPPAGAPDFWWWVLQVDGTGTQDVTYPVNLPNLDPAPHTATIRVNVQGRTTSPCLNPEHHTQVFLNGDPVPVDDQLWDGQIAFTHSVSVPSADLLSGANSIRVLVVGDTKGGCSPYFSDQVYLNYIEVDYQRTYDAIADRVAADGQGTGDFRFSLPGFSSQDVLIYDATDPNGFARITVPPAQITGSGPFTVAFQDTLAADKHYAAAALGALEPPLSVVQDVSSSLMSPANGADYIAIIPPDPNGEWLTALQPLLNHRAAEGYRILTATTEDIYDEFNGGVMDPNAIESFLDHAYADYVAPPPEFLLLVGDAHVDYLDNLGSGVPQFVPAVLRSVGGLEIPTDNEYATTAGTDLLPELVTGRLPVRSPADLATMVSKILDYETIPPVPQLNAQSLFVADNDDVGFEANLTAFASLIPPTMTANKIYLSQYTSVSAVRSDIRGGMDAGALLNIFLGHGSVSQWAAECVWSSPGSTCGVNDPAALLSTGNTSFVVALNCINGYFTGLAQGGLTDYSMAEEMVRPSARGAIAVWAPAALATLSDYSSIGDWLFRGLFLDREPSMGRAAINAVIAAVTQPFNPANSNNVRQLIFFGDPATNIALDSDGDGLLDRLEEGAGLDPLDGDSDDDGLMDGLEADFAGDSDGDGLANGLDPDSDNDGIYDGTEMGVTVQPPGTNPSSGYFVPDADPNTVTDPLDPDSDGGGVADGAEDRNFDGALDAGETDPTSGNGGDDQTCASALPELADLGIAVSGGDLALSWTGIEGTHPCTLYRVYASDDLPAPKSSFSGFMILAVTSTSGYTHAGAASDGSDHDYLVVAFDPVTGQGPLGHYGQ